MFCFKCGKEIDDNEKFCPYCGARVDDIEQDLSLDTTDTTIVMAPVLIDEDSVTPESVSEKALVPTAKSSTKGGHTALFICLAIIAVICISVAVVMINIRGTVDDVKDAAFSGSNIAYIISSIFDGNDDNELPNAQEESSSDSEYPSSGSDYTPESEYDDDETMFEAGYSYTVIDNLKVRSGPAKSYRQLNRDELTSGDYALSLDGDLAALRKGSRITALEVSDNWIRIDSGWICGFDEGFYLLVK